MVQKAIPLRSYPFGLLTSEQKQLLIQRCSKKPNERENRSKSRYDQPLLDAACETIQASRISDKNRVVEQLRLSCENPKITKQFYHNENTYRNALGFLDESKKRPDGRWRVTNRCAKRIIMKELKIRELKPMLLNSDSDPLEYFMNPQGSAGSIGVGSKAENAQLALDMALSMKEHIKQGSSFESIQNPIMPFHRAQIGDYSVDGYLTGTVTLKDRLVLGVDAATILIEGQYFIPLYEHLKSEFWCYSGGDAPDKLREKIYSCWGLHWCSADYSKFDQSIQAWVILDIFDIIKKFFPKECEMEIDWIAYNFTHGQVIFGWLGHVLQLERGIISGSFGTQALGTLSNLYMTLSYICSLALHEVRHKHGMRTDTDENLLESMETWVRNRVGCNGHIAMQAMGDDMLLFSTFKVDVSDMSRYVGKVFGVTIHDGEKGATQGYKTAPKYLKREWRGYSGEYREPLDLFVNLVHPERIRKYDEKGYTPWHILYGIYLTYAATFPGLSEDWFLEKMYQHGGVDPLLRLGPRDLPGALRIFGNKVGSVLHAAAKRHSL